MNRSITICTDFHVSLFGLILIKLFEKGFTQVNVLNDIDPDKFDIDDFHSYFFAYQNSIPSGVKKVIESFANLDIFLCNVNLFCNEEEAKGLRAKNPRVVIIPRFESAIDILDSFIKVLDETR